MSKLNVYNLCFKPQIVKTMDYFKSNLLKTLEFKNSKLVTTIRVKEKKKAQMT